MFEKATRLKLRFNSPIGALTVEDLWDLPLVVAPTSKNKACLDDIARGLHYQIKDSPDVSFVNPTEAVDPTTRLAFEIVKHIIEVRLAENAAAALKRANAERKQHLLGILAKKQDESLSQLSMDELRAAIAAL